jgi:hypothetical protein
MEKLIEVPIQSFSKTQVPSVIQIELQEAKNKNFKPQVPMPYLTIFFFFCMKTSRPVIYIYIYFKPVLPTIFEKLIVSPPKMSSLVGEHIRN